MAAERIKADRNAIAVVGLADFNRQLKKVIQDGGETGDALLKEANWRVAQYVVEKSQARAETVGRMQARAAQAMKASRTASRAQIIGTASEKVPFFFGAEFGAKQNIIRKSRKAAGWAGPGRYRGFRQFLPWRGNKGEVGYFLFPTMRAESQNIVEMYGKELDNVMRAAFPEQFNG